MDKEEIIPIIELLLSADSNCSVCGRELCKGLAELYPRFRRLIWGMYCKDHEITFEELKEDYDIDIGE